MKPDIYFKVGNLLLSITGDGNVHGYCVDEPRCLLVGVSYSDVDELARVALEAYRRRLEDRRKRYVEEEKEHSEKAAEYARIAENPEGYRYPKEFYEEKARFHAQLAKEYKLKVEDIDDRLELVESLLSLLGEGKGGWERYWRAHGLSQRAEEGEEGEE